MPSEMSFPADNTLSRDGFCAFCSFCASLKKHKMLRIHGKLRGRTMDEPGRENEIEEME